MGLVLIAAAAFASTITVNSTADIAADDGMCTLREAIIAANTNMASGAMMGECAAGEASTFDTIAFDIAGVGVKTISPASALPPIHETVVVDGYTEQPCSNNPEPCSRANTLAIGDNAELLIELDGTNTPGAPGLLLQGDVAIVRGLVINRFEPEILVEGYDSNSHGHYTLEGNFLGTDPTGLSSVSTGTGVEDHTGTANTIGGPTLAARNVMASSGDQIVIIHGLQSLGHDLIQGNYLGINAAGTAALPAIVGVHLIGSGIVGDTVKNNVIGNFVLAGVYLDGASNAVVTSNLIGTDVGGGVVLTSGMEGIRVCNGSACVNNTIGGDGMGVPVGNVIAGATVAGIGVHEGATGTVIQGNWIGIGRFGAPALGNVGCGIQLSSSGSSTVGGPSASLFNFIEYNGTSGVAIGAGTGLQVSWNWISSNGGLGVAFTSRCDVVTSPTPNDPADSDAGPDGLQNFPILAPGPFLGGTTIDGTLNGTPNATFRVDVYANDACDPSGYGEGQNWVGSAEHVATGANGDAIFTAGLYQPVPAGTILTAMATASDGSSSEFGPCTAPLGSSSTSSSSTTTTSTSTSTTETTTQTTSTSTSTTETQAAPTTTSTTEPYEGCVAEPGPPNFRSIDCRLIDLIAEVTAHSELGTLQRKLLDQLRRVKAHKDEAEILWCQTSKRRARNALRPAINHVVQFLRTLRSRKARTIPQAVKDALHAVADGIRVDMTALRRTAYCP